MSLGCGTLRVAFVCFVLLGALQVGLAERNRRRASCLRECVKKRTKKTVTLDPTNFKSAVKGYKELVKGRPYADFVRNENQWFCVFHLLNFLAPSCGNFQGGDIENPDVCCGSIQAMLDSDKGNCLCEVRIQGNSAVLGPIFSLAEQLKCEINFPIPQVEGPGFALALRGTEECKGLTRGAGSLENADFLGLTPEDIQAAGPEDLPSFRDLFVPPAPGPFSTSFTNVNITRPEPSVLVNSFSSPEVFSAIVVYPSNRAKETIDPTTGFSLDPVLADGFEKFPIVSFSPGFRTPPEAFLLMMNHLASFGMIVVSQRSTEALELTSSVENAPAWANDMAYGLLYLSEEGSNKKSFLYNRVDAGRAAVAGHSFGGISTFLAASTAADLGINVKAIAALTPVCTPFGGLCDAAATADLEKLGKPKYLLISGDEDTLGLPSHAQFMGTLVASQSPDGYSLEFRNIKGLDHCLAEADPRFWPFIPDCGSNSVSPFENVMRIQEITGKFLVNSLGSFE